MNVYEIKLAFLLYFKEEFELPIDVLEMKYMKSAGVTSIDLSEARNEIKRLLSNDNFYAYLIRQSMWKEVLGLFFEKELRESQQVSERLLFSLTERLLNVSKVSK